MPPEKELTLEQRKALAMARARKRKAEAQSASPALDSNLRTINVPDRIMGVKLPDFGPETEVVSNAAEGYQIALPANAPRAVQRGIVEGVQRGTERRRRQANLAVEGATALATNRFVAPTSGFVGDVANRFSGGRNKTLERIGAASAGGQDVASFGFGDELGGLLHGEGAKLKQRQLTADAFKEHPLSAMAGALPTMIIPGQTARGLTTLAKAGSAALRTGIPAAIYGYGSGEGGPLSADRGAKAVVYGGGGMLLGGGFQLGGRGLEYGGRKVLGSAELRSVASHIAGRGSSPGTIKLIDQAITEVQRAARVDGQSISRDIAEQRLTDAVMRAEANDMLGDLLPGGVTSMEGSALPGMEGADLVVTKLRERGEGQYKRINQAVGRIVDGEDIQSSLANLKTIKSEEAGPLYQAAFAEGRVIDQAHPRFSELVRLLNLEDFQSGIKAGQRVWRLSNGDQNADFSRLNQFEQLDWVKKGLDAEIGKTLRAGDDTTARALIDAKNRMLSIVDDMNPDYAQARRVWAGAESQREALLLGESLLSSTGKVKSGQALRDIQDQYAGYSEAEKTAFSIGLFERAVQASGDVIESGTANSAKRNFLTPNTQRELRNFLPEEQADEFLSLIEREYRQQMNANQALAGSPTGRRIKAGEAVRMATGGARAAAAELSDPQGLIRKGQEAIRNTIGNNPRVQRRFAEFLTRSADDPNLRKALGVESLPQLPPPPGGAPAAGAATSVGSPPPGAADLPMKGDTKQGYSNKDKALDAASLSLIAGGSAGSADAQTLTVSDRISGQQQEIARIDQEREAIKRDLAILNAPLLEDEAANRELVSQKQRILKSRVDGTLKIDGAYGPLTDSAVKSLRTELATSLEGNATEMQAARDRLASLEIALAEERNPGPQGITGFFQKQLPTISMIAGGALGLRTRGGAVKQSQKDALAMEQRLNRLVDPNAPIRDDFTASQDARRFWQRWNPLNSPENARRADELAYQEALQNHPPRTPPTFTSGPQGINNRATAANEWYQLGGADKHSSPFTQKADGDYVANAPKNVADPTKLFKGSNNPFKIKDAGWIGGGLFESGVSTKYLEDEKVKLKEAQDRLNQAFEAKDPVAYEAALKDIQQHETMISVYGGLQRFGLGVAGLRTIGALKSPYAKPLPSKRLATREVGSIKHSITNKKQGATGNSSGY